MTYNNKHPKQKIEKGDWIVAVNGKEGSTMAMGLAVRDNNKIRVSIRKHGDSALTTTEL